MREFSWLLLLGGLCFFFFGLQYARHGLQLLAGDRLRLIIAKMTHNRFTALGVGTLITIVLQSSTATLLMLVSLAGTGLLTLTQAFGVILGADIGTTFVVILLSIKKISDYALLFVIFGFLMEWVSKESKNIKYSGRLFFGFGMLFYGMKLMTETAAPLTSDPEIKIIFDLLADHSVALLIGATLLTVLIQTSAATIGMAIALALANIIQLPTAIPIVLGANVGTCFSVLLSSFGSDLNGKRVAVAHVFVKVAGALIAMPLLVPIAQIVERLSLQVTQWVPMIQPGVAGNIAIVHLLFNVALAVLFLPFLRGGVWVVSKIVSDKRKKDVFGPKYLDKSALETPPLAFAQAKQEILRVANLAQALYQDCLKMFDNRLDAEVLVTEIETKDDKIDLLDKAIRFYLARISQEVLSETQSRQQMALLSITSDLEGIGDVISKEMVSLARKKMEKQAIFSKQGWIDLKKLHQEGLSNFSLAITQLTSPAEELVQKIKRQWDQFCDLEQKLRQAHFGRLHEGKPESFETSSIHLDVLSNLRRISGHMIHMAKESLQT